MSKQVLYRVFVKKVPDLYVAERAGSFGRMDKKEHGMQQTKEWWETNLSPDWHKHYQLEEVEAS